MSNKGKKNLSREEFDKIKDLQGYGLKQVQVMKIVGRSSPTVSQVFRFDTFEEYLAFNRERQSKPEIQQVHPPAHNEDLSLLFVNLVEINQKLDILIEFEQERLDHAKVNKWKFGGSK